MPRNKSHEAWGIPESAWSHEIWECNRLAWEVFCKVSTQWRTGVGGVIGLDYCAIYPIIDRMAKDNDEWNALFDDVREIESGALRAMSENK